VQGSAIVQDPWTLSPEPFYFCDTTYASRRGLPCEGRRRRVTLMIEREVKLRFATPEEARAAILATGATPLRSRRLQEDALLDTEDESLRQRRCVLRIRTESGKSLITFKGAVLHGSMKVRDEYETVIGDGEVVQRVVEEVGLHVRFRYQKYREADAADD